MGQPRLRNRLDDAERARFVGRAAELAAFDALVHERSELQILLVHGEAGIGKSALLREFARRAARAGCTVLQRDGRDLHARVDLLDEALTPPVDAVRPVVILDETDVLGANLIAVRDVLLDRLPADTRLVVAARQRPDAAWWSDGLNTITTDLALGPLDDVDARTLLERYGLTDPEHQRGVLQWAQGSPLALAVGARIGAAPARRPSESALESRLATMLAGEELAGVDPRVLEVAAIAWAVDARLLAAALPGHPTRGAMNDLFGLSVAQRSGSRVRLHPVLARAVRERMRAEQPQYYDTVIRRIALHLERRALLGELQAALELGELADDPGVRAGFGVAASTTHAADRLRPEDLAALADEYGAMPWWPMFERWMQALPDYTTVVRDARGALALVGVYATYDVVAAASVDDPGIAAILALAAQEEEPRRTVIGIGAIYLDPHSSRQVLPVGNASMFARLNTTDVRWLYARLPDPSPVPEEFLATMGYVPVPGGFGEGLSVVRADFGPGGGVGYLRSIVFAEHPGPAVPARSDSAVLSPDLSDPEDVERLRGVIRAAFDESPHDVRLREVLELATLHPELGPLDIRLRLHISRATYYRLLREARERFADR